MTLELLVEYWSIISNQQEVYPPTAHQSPESERPDLSEFDGCDETAHLCWGMCDGFQTRLSKVFVVAQKGVICIKASRGQTPRSGETVKTYSSSCNAQGLPRSVLKERSNKIKTLCKILVFDPTHSRCSTHQNARFHSSFSRDSFFEKTFRWTPLSCKILSPTPTSTQAASVGE
jgi:hypothetical protein